MLRSKAVDTDATVTRPGPTARSFRLPRNFFWLVAFVVPAAVVVVAVQFYPLAYSLFLSTQDWYLTRSPAPLGFNGLANFARVLANPVFRQSVQTSIIITSGAVTLEMLFGISLAYLFMGNSWRMRAARTIMILPLVVAPVAAGTMWRMLLNSRAGLISYLLGLVGIQGPEWLASTNWARVAVILVETWQATPFVLLVVTAGITSIPAELREAAAIDGASRWQALWRVEFPLLTPILLLTLMFRVLDSLLSLDTIYSLTFGGPGYGTFTLSFYIFTLGLRNFALGDAAAASWLFMAFTALLIVLMFRLQSRAMIE